MTRTTSTSTTTTTTTTCRKTTMRTMLFHPTAIIVSILLLFSCMIHQSNASYSFTIKPGKEECFVFRTPEDRTSIVTGSFDCLDDDVEAKEFGATISEYATEKIMYRAPKGALEGSFLLENVAQGSKYELCFQNEVGSSNIGEEQEGGDDESENEFHVGFSIRVSNLPRTLEEGVLGPDSERALKLVQKASKIHQDWNILKDHVEFTRNREAIHDEMGDAILSRLTRWTYIEAFLVIGMATGQVIYWKKFFETRRYL